MGDRLEDEDWAAEAAEEENEASVAADWVEDEHSNSDGDSDEDEVESIAEWKEQANKELKKEKKQAKFAALKERKKQRMAEEKESEREAAQLSPEEMLREIEEHAPVPYRTYQQLQQQPFFTAEDFFFPALEASAAMESATKTPCPFVRALSASLPNYKKLLLSPEDAQLQEKRGSPVMVILTASAIRATQVIKSVSAKLIKVKIAKLFAKHFKIAEQIEMLSKEYFPIVIGTPNRIEKLIELGALSLKDTQILLADHSPDLKSFTMLTLQEVKNDFYKLFYEYVHPERAHMKIALIKDPQAYKASAGDKNNNKNNNKGNHKPQKRKYGKHDNSQRQGFKSDKEGATTNDGNNNEQGDNSNKKRKPSSPQNNKQKMEQST